MLCGLCPQCGDILMILCIVIYGHISVNVVIYIHSNMLMSYVYPISPSMASLMITFSTVLGNVRIPMISWSKAKRFHVVRYPLLRMFSVCTLHKHSPLFTRLCIQVWRWVRELETGPSQPDAYKGPGRQWLPLEGVVGGWWLPLEEYRESPFIILTPGLRAAFIVHVW